MKKENFRLNITKTGDCSVRTVKLVQSPFPWRFSGQKSEEPGPEYSVNSGLETS